jgi:hypothetical protein
MKSSYLAQVASAALLFGFGTAYAQTPNTAPAPPAKAVPVSTTPDTTGNDLLDSTKPPAQNNLATPATAGEDKADGNDLVSGDNRTDRETGTHPAWRTLDVRKSGYLTAKDVKSHKWLTKNFSRCNSSHDGHLTETEYASCTKG